MKTPATGTRTRYLASLAAAGLGWTLLSCANGQTASSESIVDALRDGGYVLVMRHADAREEEEQDEPSENGFGRGRRGPALDETAQAHATAIGYAFRELDVEIGEVLSSPAPLALLTIRYLGYRDPQVFMELGPESEQSGWLLDKAAEQPADGTNILIVTHGEKIGGAFADAPEIDAGETLVVRPDGSEVEVVGSIPVRDWAKLAVAESDS